MISSHLIIWSLHSNVPTWAKLQTKPRDCLKEILSILARRPLRKYTKYTSRHIWNITYNVSWSPHSQKVIRCLEEGQQQAAKMLAGLQSKSYSECLIELGLTTLHRDVRYNNSKTDMMCSEIIT
jgi:hypothetical protein